MTHILVVEDGCESCQLYMRVLTKNGYQVTGVSNGQEALDAIDKTYFDLIINCSFIVTPYAGRLLKPYYTIK